MINPVDEPIYRVVINIYKIIEAVDLYLKEWEFSSDGITRIIPNDIFCPLGCPLGYKNTRRHRLFGK